MSEKQDLSQNPFTALFTTVGAATQFSAQSSAAPANTAQQGSLTTTQLIMLCQWCTTLYTLLTDKYDLNIHVLSGKLTCGYNISKHCLLWYFLRFDCMSTILIFAEDGEQGEDDTQYKMDVSGMIEKIFLITLDNGKR